MAGPGLHGREPSDPTVDRWERRDWWGVVLECRDAKALAEFYSRLLGWPLWKPEEADEDGAVLDPGEGVSSITFQRDPDFQRPVWPPERGRPRMTMHLDFQVTELSAAVDHALELGATLADFQPQDDVRVMLDPDGHPFCLYT